jgi:hypothetical protein
MPKRKRTEMEQCEEVSDEQVVPFLEAFNLKMEVFIEKKSGPNSAYSVGFTRKSTHLELFKNQRRLDPAVHGVDHIRDVLDDHAMFYHKSMCGWPQPGMSTTPIADDTHVDLDAFDTQEKFHDYLLDLTIHHARYTRPQQLVLGLPAAKLTTEHVDYLINEYKAKKQVDRPTRPTYDEILKTKSPLPEEEFVECIRIMVGSYWFVQYQVLDHMTGESEEDFEVRVEHQEKIKEACVQEVKKGRKRNNSEESTLSACPITLELLTENQNI